MKALILLALLSIILSQPILAATIHGTVYEISLDPVKNIIVEINTNPSQRLVSKTGSYSFEVPKGTYNIIAKKTSASEPLTQEKITVATESGGYVVDLFIFPEFEEKQEKADYWPYIIVVLLVLITSFIIYKKYRKKPKQVQEEIKQEDDLPKKLIELIKNNEGRITQKELRKHFPLSEAKISLVITQLEKEGKLEKIKKGRGNILILK